MTIAFDTTYEVTDEAYTVSEKHDVLDVEKLCATDSQFDSEFGRRIKAADKDGDGRLSVGEIRSVVWSEIEGWKRAKSLRAILIGLSIFAVLVVGANVAMAITVAEMSKDTHIGSDGIMTMKNGKGFVATSQAATSTPLLEAYNLSVNDLRQITQIIVPDDDGSTSVFQVQQLSVHPKISVTFYLVGGSSLSIEEGSMAFGSASTGRRLLQTDSATGISTSATSLRPEDGYYGNGY